FHRPPAGFRESACDRCAGALADARHYCLPDIGAGTVGATRCAWLGLAAWRDGARHSDRRARYFRIELLLLRRHHQDDDCGCYHAEILVAHTGADFYVG